MQNIRRYLALALAVAIPAAHASNVYKCVAKSGAVIYQNDVCPANTRALRSWDTQALSEPDATDLAQRQAQERRDSAYLNKLVRRKSDASRLHVVRMQSSACEQIKARRDAQLQRSGNDMGFEARRRWNDQVYEACR